MEREAEIIIYIPSFKSTWSRSPSCILPTSSFSAPRLTGAVQIRRDRALTASTTPRSVSRSRIRRVCVMVLPSGSMALTMMLEVMVNTSVRTKP